MENFYAAKSKKGGAGMFFDVDVSDQVKRQFDFCLTEDEETVSRPTAQMQSAVKALCRRIKSFDSDLEDDSESNGIKIVG